MTPEPLPGEMSVADLELFWSPYIETDCAPMIADEFWSSLGDMTRAVDLVVVGRPISVFERYSSWALRPVPVLEIAIDEIIRGTPSANDAGRIELETYYGPPPDTSLGLPANRHLFFLQHVNTALAEHGQTADTREHAYNLPSLYQNVLIEEQGTVFLPAYERVARDDFNSFPAELHGSSYEEVLIRVREAAATNSRGDAVVGSMRFAC
jgi:hypothetical protein